MNTIEDYINSFIQTNEYDKIKARKINILDYNPPSDSVLLYYANNYHYGFGCKKNLCLAYQFYSFAHHKNGDVTETKPITPVSILQYLELMRELENGNDELIKIFGSSEASDYYMWEMDLLAVAIEYKFKWVISYILELIIEANSNDHEEDEFGKYRTPSTYNTYITKVFEDWDFIREIIKEGYIG